MTTQLNVCPDYRDPVGAGKETSFCFSKLERRFLFELLRKMKEKLDALKTDDVDNDDDDKGDNVDDNDDDDKDDVNDNNDRRDRIT